MNNEVNKQSHWGILKDIPKWILPTSYIIIVSMGVLTLYILNLIPYEHSVSYKTLIYNDEHRTDENDTAYGEILLSNIYGITTGDLVEFIGVSCSDSQIPYKGSVIDIYYDNIRNTYIIKIEVTRDHSTRNYSYPMKGIATIVYQTDTLLEYLMNSFKQFF